MQEQFLRLGHSVVLQIWQRVVHIEASLVRGWDIDIVVDIDISRHCVQFVNTGNRAAGVAIRKIRDGLLAYHTKGHSRPPGRGREHNYSTK